MNEIPVFLQLTRPCIYDNWVLGLNKACEVGDLLIPNRQQRCLRRGDFVEAQFKWLTTSAPVGAFPHVLWSFLYRSNFRGGDSAENRHKVLDPVRVLVSFEDEDCLVEQFKFCSSRFGGYRQTPRRNQSIAASVLSKNSLGNYANHSRVYLKPTATKLLTPIVVRRLYKK